MIAPRTCIENFDTVRPCPCCKRTAAEGCTCFATVQRWCRKCHYCGDHCRCVSDPHGPADGCAGGGG